MASLTSSNTASVVLAPSLAGFQRKAAQGIRATKVPDLNVRMNLDKQSVQKTQAEVAAAAKRIEAARETEIRSSEKLRLAERRLAEARSKFAADSSKVVAAENALNAARRESVRTQSAVSKATADHEVAVNRASEATKRFEESSRRSVNPLARLHLTLRAANGEFDKTGSRALKAAGSLSKIAAGSIAAGGALSSLASSVGVVTTLGGALVSASGAAAALPGVLAGVGVSAAVAKLGVSGFTDAVSKGGEDLDKLSPAARKAAEALRALAPQWDKLRRSVQDRMFRGVSDDIQSLASKALPLLRRQLPEIAAGWNDAFRGVLQYLAQTEPLRKVGSILNNTATFTKSLGEAFKPAVAGLLGFTTIGSEYLPAVGRWIKDGARAFDTFVNSAAGTQKIRGWIDGGITALRQLGELAGNVGGVIASVFRAASAEGATTIQTLIGVTAGFRDFLNSARGQEILTTLFSNLRGLIDNLRPGLDAVGRVIGHLIMQVAPLLPSLGTAISNVAQAAEPLVRVLITLATSILGPLLSLIGQFPTVFVGAAVAVGGLALAIKTLVAYAAFRAWLTGIIGLLSSTGLAGAAAAAGGAMRGFGGALLAAATGPVGLSLIALAGLITAIKATSVSMDTAVTAIRAGGVAADEMRAKVAAQTSQVGNGLVPAIDSAAASFDNWVKSNIFGMATTDSVNAKIAQQETAQRQLNAAYVDADAKHRAYQNAVNTWGANSPQAIATNAAYQGSVDALKWAQQQAGVAVDGHTAALQRQANQFMSSIDSEIAWKGAIDSATQSVRTNGATVDINTAAGRNNMTQLQALSRAAFADIEAKRQHGASTDVITKLTDAHRRQLFNTARQMGMSEQAAWEYVNQLNLTPPDMTTRIHTPGLTDGIKNVKEMNDLMRQLDGGKVNVAVTRMNLPGLGAGRAAGGPISGPGTGTSDSIPMRLSNGEYVIREKVTRREGAGKMGLLNSGLGTIVPKSALPGRARGGPVSNDITYDFRALAASLAAEKAAMFPPDVMMIGGNGDAGQLGNARIIAQVARAMGFGRNGLVVALATALQESGLRNLNYGDRDSVGLFQQRTSQGWGSIAQIMNPGYSASKFFQALRGVRGWERMPVTVAAQRVQRSAFPNAYAKWVGLANSLASQVGFKNGGVVSGGKRGRDDTLVLAQSGERVLTTEQNRWLESALQSVSASGAVRQMQKGRDLAGVGTGGAVTKSVTGFHADQVVMQDPTMMDAAMSRATFLAGGL